MRKLIITFLGLVMLVLFSSWNYRYPDALSNENKYDLGSFMRKKENHSERVKLIADPFTAYQARLAMIQSAENEIFMSSYIIHPGESSDAIMSAIYDAAERGVKISMVFDGKMGKVHRRYGALAKHPNISIYRYNPLNLRHWKQLHSVYHEKYLWVDHQYLLMGGRNIGDKYFFEDEKIVSYDYDVLIDANSKPSQVMDTVYEHQKMLLSHPLVKRYEAPRFKRMKFYVESPVVDLKQIKEGSVEVKRIDVLFDPIGETQARLFDVYQNLLKESQESAFLQSPYMTKHKAMLNDWDIVTKQGLDLNLLTNSPASSPNYPAYAVYHRDKEQFIRSGLGVYEYQNRHKSIHGKAYYFDQKYLYIGSMNLDHRSFYVNPESMLLIESEGLNKMFEEVISEHLQNSAMIQEGSYQAGLSQPLRASFLKRCLLFLTALFMRFFQHLI